MEEQLVREIPGRQYQRCADMFAVEQELEIAIRYCDLALETDFASKGSNIIIDGLALAAVIRYARCCKGGLRYSLEVEKMEGLSPELLRLHNYFLLLRDKHLAHAVNVYEQPYLKVGLRLIDGVFQRDDVSILPGVETVVLSRGNVQQLRILILEVRHRAAQLRNLEVCRLLKDDISKLSDEFLLNLKPHEDMEIGEGDLKQAREHWNQGGGSSKK